MIIDLILDRKEGKNRIVKNGKLYTTNEYNAKRFYNEVMSYGQIGWEIAEAMDSGDNKDVQKALAHYIVDNNYNPDIIKYIQANKWI